MRFHAPAFVFLRRAQLILILAALVPTVLMIGVGILVLSTGSGSVNLAAGILVLAFCTSALTGYILVSVFVSRGASEARFQSDYVSTVSHELRTPLTSIHLFIETLANEALDAEEKSKCLTLLNQEMERLEGLVDRLFELSRIEAGHHHFERAQVLVADLVEDALSVFAAQTVGQGTGIDDDLEDDLVVAGDHTALVRALSNLLTNAWKYTPEDDKEISLTARSLGKKHIEIAVIDNGPGIPWAEQRQIFEKFHRSENAKESGAAGSGLGLAIVRAIVRAHKGRIEVHSLPGNGSEFRIRLRRAVG